MSYIAVCGKCGQPADPGAQQCLTCAHVGPGPVLKRSEALVLWIVYATAVAAITWFWKNPWVSAPLVAILAIPISRLVQLTFLRVIVVAGFTVGAFFLVGQWASTNTERVTPVGLGVFQLGMTVSELQGQGFDDVEPGRAVGSEGYENVWGHVTEDGILGAISLDASGNSDPPEWSTKEGIQATSSMEDFMKAYPDATRFDGKSFSIAWANFGGNAIMLTSYWPGKGQLEVGLTDIIQASFAEAMKPEPTTTGAPAGNGGGSEYGSDEAYQDVLNGCLGEAQRLNGQVTPQDQDFCDSYARSIADQM